MPADSPVPNWVGGDGFFSVTRTASELSIVAQSDRVPDDVTAETGFTAVRVVGTLDFSETGILSAISTALARAAIPVFVVSTFETDYFFIPSDRKHKAYHALQLAGIRISNTERVD
jgi:hypothetical protein